METMGKQLSGSLWLVAPMEREPWMNSWLGNVYETRQDALERRSEGQVVVELRLDRGAVTVSAPDAPLPPASP